MSTASESPDPPAVSGMSLYARLPALASEKLARERPGTDTVANQMAVALNRASQLLIYDFESSVHRDRGLSWAAYRVLFTLWIIGPLTPQSTAEAAGMSRSAVSNLTKTLVREGLIAQQDSPEDGRSKILTLTGEGASHLEDVFPSQNQVESEWADALTPIEQGLFVSLLEKLLNGSRATRIRTQRG
jgi:DNA-binding MarR family transcriptional regulator